MKKLLTAILALGLAAPIAAQDVLINNVKVVTVSGDEIENGAIEITGDRISYVGEARDNGGADRTIDGEGLTAYPGWFASMTQVGMVEVGAVDMTDDTDEGIQPNTAHVRAMDAYNPLSSLIAVQRMNGVTTAHIVPRGGNVFSGQSAVVSLTKELVDEALIAAPTALHINMGEGPKGRYGGRNRTPQTRMGLASFIRDEFVEAQEYKQKWDRFEEKTAHYGEELADYEAELAEWEATPEADREDDRPEEPEKPEPPSRDLLKDVLVKALNQEIPVAFNAHRLDDISTALRLSDEFGLDPILVGASSSWKVADHLAERGVPVILSPLQQPSGMQTSNAMYELAAFLTKAGVKVAFEPDDTSHNLRNLPYEAGIAQAFGMPHEAALRAITLSPAEIWGVADHVGSIDEGKLANIILVDGDPFQPLTKTHHVFIMGEEVELWSRQTDLAERYGRELLPDGYFDRANPR